MIRRLVRFSLRPLYYLFQVDILVADIVEITLQRLVTKKFRSILTVMGMGIGVGAVYFLVSLTFGVQKLVIGKIATSESLLSLDVLPNTDIKNMVRLNSQVISKIQKLDQVAEVSPAKSLPAEISYNHLKAQTVTYGVDPSFFRLSGMELSGGQYLTSDSTNQVIVSSSVLSLFNLNPKTALGARIRLSFLLPSDLNLSATPSTASAGLESASQVVAIPQQFVIGGIVNDEANYLYLLNTHFNLVNYDEYKLVKVKVKSQSTLNQVREQIVSQGFLVSAMTDTLDQINKIFNVTQITFTLIGIVALLIAAIGMLNTMTVSLLERTREIGIMKAIGATERGIQQMFLAESVLMGLGGGGAGLVIGFVFCQLVNFFVNLLALSLGGSRLNIFYTPLWFLMLVFCFSLVIGFFTGLFPARRASRLNPLDALRYE
ncbi:MAG: FtsX-like permease family protein [Candidatus Shapirobacteria bacterium]